MAASDTNHPVVSAVIENKIDIQSNVMESPLSIDEHIKCILSDFNIEKCILFPHLKHFRNDHPKNFIFAHLNINWFHTKFHEVYELLTKGLIDCYAISETKLNPTIKNGVFKSFLKDLSFYRQDRPQAECGGGTVCYIKSCLRHTDRNDLGYNRDGIVLSKWCLKLL